MTSARSGIRVGALSAAVFVLVALGTAIWEGGRSVEHERTLLVTGFGPFGPYSENPSWEAARALDGERVGLTRIRVARLDVTYAQAGEQLMAAIRDTHPDRVLCLGVAPGASLRIETLARNRDEADVPDNDGVVREGRPIRPEGPAFLPTGLPVRALVETLRSDGYEVETSEDAGGYLCNHVFYRLRDTLADRTVSGFVHVPPVSEAWPLERIRAAVRAVIAVLDETR